MERGENIMKIKKLNKEKKQCTIVSLGCSCYCGDNNETGRFARLKAAQNKSR